MGIGLSHARKNRKLKLVPSCTHAGYNGSLEEPRALKNKMRDLKLRDPEFSSSVCSRIYKTRIQMGFWRRSRYGCRVATNH